MLLIADAILLRVLPYASISFSSFANYSSWLLYLTCWNHPNCSTIYVCVIYLWQSTGMVQFADCVNKKGNKCLTKSTNARTHIRIPANCQRMGGSMYNLIKHCLQTKFVVYICRVYHNKCAKFSVSCLHSMRTHVSLTLYVCVCCHDGVRFGRLYVCASALVYSKSKQKKFLQQLWKFIFLWAQVYYLIFLFCTRLLSLPPPLSFACLIRNFAALLRLVCCWLLESMTKKTTKCDPIRFDFSFVFMFHAIVDVFCLHNSHLEFASVCLCVCSFGRMFISLCFPSIFLPFR